MTVAECDRRLIAVHAALLDAEEHGDAMQADLDRVMLDSLLDLRCLLPVQRKP